MRADGIQHAQQGKANDYANGYDGKVLSAQAALVIHHDAINRAIPVHIEQHGVEGLHIRPLIAVLKRDAQVNRHNVVSEHAIKAGVLGDESVKRLHVRHPAVHISFG